MATATAVTSIAGHEDVAKSLRVAEVETQSPATDQPLRRPMLRTKPPNRIPARSSRSTVIASEIEVRRSIPSQSPMNSAEERTAENRTASTPGPFPTFAPAKEQDAPVSAPMTAQEEARFPLSRTSSLALIAV